MSNNEQTTKFKVDISELKKEFQEAQRHIQVVNSEFKAATAGMGKWSDSADGLSAKIKQLNDILDDEKTKQKSLQSQYDKTVEVYGKTSKAAQELEIKLNNQKATVKNIESSIKHYNDRLDEMQAESKQSATATDKLRQSIGDQESELASLKSKYADLVAEQKQGTQEAKDLAKKIQDLSSELKQNKSALSDAESAADQFDKSLDDVANSAKDAGDGFTVMKGALADLIADGIKSATGALKDFVLESDAAYDKFQAQTGASTEEMKEFQEQMDDIYEGGYGESLEDIGDKMAYVKQVTGEVDPSKLKELTENAMALEDTFGSDFNETIRGVSNLMNHFGIDSEEAFDLFAKGSQLGLDYTDELGDNIAEYGGNFEQAGYSAEEYFQLLVNGSKNGAYNLDKVNDSINEVKNRLGDGTIGKNIDLFSDGTKKVFKAWENGEGTMKDAIDSIVDDINNCENEQEALNMAATAFGTMGEDANLKVVKSLKSTGDSFKDVKDKMEEVKDIRYDNVGTQFKTLGRTLMNELVKPLAAQVLPSFEKLGETAIENMDKTIPVAKTLGVALGGIFVTNKIATFVTSLKTLVPAFTLIKGATDAQTASTLALNTAWLASPITWLVAGLAALTAAVVIYNKKQDETIEKEYGLSEAEQATIDTAKELKSAYDEMNDARNESVSAITSEYGYLDQLKSELNGLIDSNGQVKAGYEDRANFIVNQLASALGLEKDKIWEIIQSNGQLGESIDDIIRKKQAEATLTANETAYTEAIQKRNEALSVYQDNLTTLESAEKKYKETKAAANEVMEQYELMLQTNPEAASFYLMGQSKVIKANDEAKASYDKAKKGVEESEEAYIGYNTTIQNYEGLSSAIISGDMGKISDALVNMQNNFVTAENGTKKSLENQVKNMQKNYKDLKQAIENNTPGVTQEMVDQAKTMVDKAEEELDKLTPKASTSGKNAGQKYADGVGSKSGEGKKKGEEVSKKTNEGLDSSNTKKTGEKKGNEYKDGVDSTKSSNKSKGEEVSNKTNEGLAAANTKGTGQAKGSEFANGVGDKQNEAKFSGAVVAGKANEGLAAADAYSTGNNFTAGFTNGMTLGQAARSLWTSAWNLGKKALKALKEAIDEGSPSKLTYKSGNFFVAGFANAISDGVKTAANSAAKMGKEAIEALNNEMAVGINTPVINDLPSSMRVVGNNVKQSGVQNQGKTGGTVINQNFYQTNNSPKSLSRIEIYRQTKNQLNFAKGVS